MKYYENKKMNEEKVYSADDVEEVLRDFVKKDKEI